jgi:glycosyltransferase involved in cell wall biosynthesis
MSRFNILAVGQFPPHPGGAALSLYQLLDELSKLGHRVRVLAPIAEAARAEGQDLSAYDRRIDVTRFPVPYFQLMAKITDNDDYFRIESEAITRLLGQLIAEDRPDLILVGRETYAMLTSPIAQSAKIPVLLRVAGATTIAIEQGRLSPKLTEKLLAGYHLADRIVTPARHMADRLAALGIGNVAVLPNAVDEVLFHDGPRDSALAAALGIPADHLVVAHISNMATMKRPLDLLEAAPAVLSANPKTLFLFVGSGEESEQLTKRAAALGITGRVHTTGWVPYAQMSDHVRLADIVVMPASDETQARVYLETRAAGRVLVASDIPAAREVVDHKRTGVLFPMGNIQALSSALIALAADPAERARLGRLARAELGLHRLSVAVAAYIHLFKDLSASRQ